MEKKAQIITMFTEKYKHTRASKYILDSRFFDNLTISG
jgi:hypothetical protein